MPRTTRDPPTTAKSGRAWAGNSEGPVKTMDFHRLLLPRTSAFRVPPSLRLKTTNGK